MLDVTVCVPKENRDADKVPVAERFDGLFAQVRPIRDGPEGEQGGRQV
jgi:hypothetical protein